MKDENISWLICEFRFVISLVCDFFFTWCFVYNSIIALLLTSERFSGKSGGRIIYIKIGTERGVEGRKLKVHNFGPTK